MKRDIEELLKKKAYYPLTTPLWNSFQFIQVKPKSNQERQNNLEIIELNVKDKKGIYVYRNEADEVLYVGKGSPLKSRIQSHYNKLSKVNSVSRRDTFFQNDQGVMTIFWLEIEEKEERELTEHLLSYLLNPKYKKWRAI
ncbi:GIY-YIG nuclease family protein [Ectobacillus sp. JY-23]|uniref:GIY-YIG nuclease family protein n=1 Tax=Ectobacillus sp. JY-23 TaxID=2933872 RepID=UPI001FF44BB4|nr:GIY-YIG nuclease family protein [Ectobacillus sp. JY-23]UOY93149.1 GIY-YIG nuclease family protein [Ectobacillus sp. JY-23]